MFSIFSLFLRHFKIIFIIFSAPALQNLSSAPLDVFDELTRILLISFISSLLFAKTKGL
jgi:hypothetical protein